MIDGISVGIMSNKEGRRICRRRKIDAGLMWMKVGERKYGLKMQADGRRLLVGGWKKVGCRDA